MKLYVPDIGDRLTLSAEWNFTLYDEYRNKSLITALGYTTTGRWNYNREMRTWPATIPAGVVLVIDRVYIRKGKQMGDYSSITFRAESTKDKELKIFNKCRFWVKIADANEIEFDHTKLSKRTEQVNVGSTYQYSLGSYVNGETKLENLNSSIIEVINRLIGKTFEVKISTQPIFDGELYQIIMDLKSMSDHVALEIANHFCDLSLLTTIYDQNSKSSVSYKKLTVKYYRRIDELVKLDKKNEQDRRWFHSQNRSLHLLKWTNFYELFDGETFIGKWSSDTSLIKKAKEYLTTIGQDSAHEKFSSAKDMFEV